MHRSLLAALILPLLSPAAALAATPPSGTAARLTVEFSHPQPSAGTPVYFRVRFENTGFRSLRVPADLMDHLVVEGTRVMPWQQHLLRAPRHDDATPAQTVDADKITWRTLRPDDFIEVRGALGDVFADLCDKGCRSGAYQLRADVRYPIVSGIESQGAPAAWVPRGLHGEGLVKVVPHRLPVGAEAVSVALSGPSWSDDGGLRVMATFTNTSRVPVWVPKPEHLAVSCTARVVTSEDTSLQTRHSIPAHQTPWQEADAVSVPAGGAVTLPIACNGMDPGDAEQVHVKLKLRPVAAFFPDAPVSPYYLSARLEAPEIRVR